jgi:hypothetical protein
LPNADAIVHCCVAYSATGSQAYRLVSDILSAGFNQLAPTTTKLTPTAPLSSTNATAAMRSRLSMAISPQKIADD